MLVSVLSVGTYAEMYEIVVLQKKKKHESCIVTDGYLQV
jgi:hypothetical protein